ncbi:hypothetical protein CO614_08425 [Lysobacteraceae bacterium NML120232]|nr:hypothetical protein CO614_08425 [Xanthomonadaceae bacterium NML120232]
MSVFIEAEKIYLEIPYETQGDDYDSEVGLLGSLALARTSRATVLSGVSFTAKEGDRIGIMGLNGAGKTTLLKVLNGAYAPTSGSLRREGSLQSLLTTMLGFNEYATIAENIILRGTAMGLRYRQMRAVIDDVLEFSGLEDKASRQLHTLSTGQRMRLGFAISTTIQPDILLMDEWIGTGDAAFVEKAKQRMMNRFSGSKISIIASHSVGLLKSLCNKGLVLDKGRMVYFGGMEDGINVYHKIVEHAKPDEKKLAAASDPLLFGDISGSIDKVVFDAAGRVSILGWAVGARKEKILAMEIATSKGVYFMEDMRRMDRPDVNLYFGKKAGADLGFLVTLPCLVDENEKGRFLASLKVRAGASEESLGEPLPFAFDRMK